MKNLENKKLNNKKHIGNLSELDEQSIAFFNRIEEILA